MPYIQLALFPLLAAAGIFLGRRIGKAPKWWLAVALTLALVGLVILGQRVPRLHFLPPMSWLVHADVNPLLMTAAVSLLLTTLLVRLPRASTRRLLALAMAIILVVYGLLPALMPILIRGSLRATPTIINRQGVCLQQHGYSCGPAAAVTCLHALGIEAQEGTLAVAAQCGPAVGTDGHRLAVAVRDANPGIIAEYRYVDAPENLRLPAVADMYMPRIGGHYVAVLALEKDAVVIGDPLGGLDRMPRAEFLADWKNGAVEIHR